MSNEVHKNQKKNKKPRKKLTWLFIVPSLLGGAWVVLSIFFAVLSFHIYSRLSYEEPIARLSFQKQQDKVYMANITTKNSNSEAYKIFGDQWRIDAQFIKLHAWANLFGLDALYKIERLEGRYKNLQEQNTLKHRAYDLSDQKAIQIPQFLIDYNFLIDAEYGSSTYLAIDESKIYTVYRTQSGILVRQTADPTKAKTGLMEQIIEIFKP